MTHAYFVTDDTGLVICTGTCQEGELESNTAHLQGTLHIGVAPFGRHRFINGEFIPVVVEPNYAEQRRMQYLPIEEQLDSLWHAMHKGILPKIEPMYGDILRVKTNFPKPEN